MLGALHRRALPVVQGVLVLQALYRECRDRTLQHHADLLLQCHRDEVLRDLESILHPAVCIVAEKGCNFQLFDGILQDRKTGLLVSRRDRLAVEDGLTESYILGRDLPKDYKYCILSPYVKLNRFQNREHFIIEYRATGRVKDGVIRTLLDLIRFLDQGCCSLYERDGVWFRRVETRDFVHIRAHFGTAGSYEQTRYKYRSRIMEDVEALGRELRHIRMGRDISSFMTEVTQRLLDQLSSLGVFKGEADIETFPDLVPILFPFRMMAAECWRLDCAQLITVGFDLRGAAASHLGFLFNAERVASIIRAGGVYVCTVAA